MFSRSNPGYPSRQGFKIIPCCQHAQYMLYGQLSAPDDGFAAEYLWINGDAFQKLVFFHGLYL